MQGSKSGPVKRLPAPYADAAAEDRPDLAQRLGVPRCMTAPFDCGTKIGIAVTLESGRRHAVRCVEIEEGIAALADWLSCP
jgi:hypothetical protein